MDPYESVFSGASTRHRPAVGGGGYTGRGGFVGRSTYTGHPGNGRKDYTGRGYTSRDYVSGFGDALQCGPGQMEPWLGAGFCIPTINPTSSGCASGTFEPWPGAGICIPAQIGNVTPPPIIPGPCPSGTYGIPPYCYSPAAIPGPTSTIPPVAAPPTAPPSAPPVATAPPSGSKLPEWVVPGALAIGVIAVVALAMSKKKATANRRRSRRR